jgi:predicted XRE-type DNA-binding protein
MSKKRFANVWDAIEDTPAQAENMKVPALIMALKDHIARTGLARTAKSHQEADQPAAKRLFKKSNSGVRSFLVEPLFRFRQPMAQRSQSRVLQQPVLRREPDAVRHTAMQIS